MARQDRSDPGYGSGPQRYPGSFLLALREAVAALDWKIARWLGGAVECVDAKGREHVVGLENLYRRARREDRGTWPELIVSFLDLINAEHLQEPPAALPDVAERLLLRLGRPLAARDDGLELWSQPLPGTTLGVNLVVDYPQSMYYVTAQMIEESGRPGGEWLERAVANLRAQTPEDCFQVIHEESGLRQCNVGDAYDSSRVLLLDALLPQTSADGYFVALPGRDELLVLPLTGASVGYVPLLKSIAEQSFRTAPYAISDELFWVRGGLWHLFPIELRGEEVTAQPPRELMEVLHRLVPDEEDEAPEEGAE